MLHFLFIFLLSIHIGMASDDGAAVPFPNGSASTSEAPQVQILAWPEDADPLTHVVFATQHETTYTTFAMDRSLAEKSFNLVQEQAAQELDNKETAIIPLYLERYEQIMRVIDEKINQEQINTKITEDLDNLIKWLEAYDKDPSSGKLPSVTLGIMLIADNLNLQGNCIQKFYQHAAQKLNFQEMVLIMDGIYRVAYNCIKYTPSIVYKHMAEAKKRFPKNMKNTLLL